MSTGLNIHFALFAGMNRFTRKLSREILGVVDEDLDTTILMQELREHSAEKYCHSMRVGKEAVEIGIELELPLIELILLGFGGRLHDIGHRETPLEVLNYRGEELPLEYRAVLDDHPRKGFEILRDFKYPIVAQIAAGHQEFQNRPYPRREGIRDPYSLVTRLTEIVAVADMFDGMRYSRSYKPVWPLEKVEEIMKKQSTANPEYIQAVLKTAPRYAA